MIIIISELIFFMQEMGRILNEFFLHSIIPFQKRQVNCASYILILILISLTIMEAKGEDSQGKKPDVTESLPPSSTVMGTFKQAAVVSNGKPCAAIGKNILQMGGNAIEAAIATMLCDGVVCFESMGIGGGFLMTIYRESEGKAYVLNARETAPAKATEDMYKGNKTASEFEFRYFQEAFNKFGSGKVTWEQLFEPTIKLCEEGFAVSQHMEMSIKTSKDLILKSPALKEILVNDKGEFLKLNDTVKLPKLAETLRTISKSQSKAEEFYNGCLTKGFVDDIQADGGIITMDDMKNYQVYWQEPSQNEIGSNLTFFSTPLPGSGLLLNFIMEVLDDGFLNSNSLDDPKAVHRVVEAFKHAFGMRSNLGDPRFTNQTQESNILLDANFIKTIRGKIRDNWTSTNVSYYGADFDTKSDHGTANIVVLSANGDAVSVTSTVNLLFGGKFVSKSTGILLNNEMDDFSAPHITNFFGVPPSPANFIKPGKTPLSSMSPTIAIDKKSKKVVLVVGAAGGTRILTSTTWVSILTIYLGKSIKQAIDMPRIHHQLLPMVVSYEYGTLKSTVEALQKIGHNTTREDRNSGVTGILRTSGIIEANADIIKNGACDGF
ncbi:scoloptoxin SSD14 [Nilaparvata lugens]|uniref:scoloptoxin SSD14 n=1 Tax=Nilaparvata lugens TaxID=108931 RepID=UPI00193EB70A|nr:scoloptoxin SSD14 [Nilaparvata lugens]